MKPLFSPGWPVLVSKRRTSRPIIELSSKEARAFLLKPESYCTIGLPPYFQFKELLKNISDEFKGRNISSFWKCRKLLRSIEDVNYRFLHNKDGRYAWRPLELIHPALYVSLVHRITEECHWNLICEHFQRLKKNQCIKCLSLPVESLTKEKDKAKQVNQWWENVEQKSIELSLDYELLIHTDIVDCYAAIYTHSIAWALHTKEVAKKNRTDKNLVGNIIDHHIQDMQQGQTNGIPQGSVLMDFIAEMMLGYADIELAEKLEENQIDKNNYQILRYRDDYRIFINNRQDGEKILKCLTEVMIDLGLKLNPQKTKTSDKVIGSSIKEDKLGWLFRKQRDKNLQKHLLIIHDHSIKHPNTGSLLVSLNKYYKRLHKGGKCGSPLPLISIVVDIAFHNPRSYPICFAILSKLISFLDNEQSKQKTIEKIQKKFSMIPNTEHMQIWLQRISLGFFLEKDFDEPLCKLVHEKTKIPWNNEWLQEDLRELIDASQIIDQGQLDNLLPIIPIEEVELFSEGYP